MAKVIELSDEQFRTIDHIATRRGQTPDTLLAQLIEQLRDEPTEPRYYDTEDWFRHLCATEEQIAETKRLAASRHGTNDANA